MKNLFLSLLVISSLAFADMYHELSLEYGSNIYRDYSGLSDVSLRYLGSVNQIIFSAERMRLTFRGNLGLVKYFNVFAEDAVEPEVGLEAMWRPGSAVIKAGFNSEWHWYTGDSVRNNLETSVPFSWRYDWERVSLYLPNSIFWNFFPNWDYDSVGFSSTPGISWDPIDPLSLGVFFGLRLERMTELTVISSNFVDTGVPAGVAEMKPQVWLKVIPGTWGSVKAAWEFTRNASTAAALLPTAAGGRYAYVENYSSFQSHRLALDAECLLFKKLALGADLSWEDRRYDTRPSYSSPAVAVLGVPVQMQSLEIGAWSRFSLTRNIRLHLKGQWFQNTGNDYYTSGAGLNISGGVQLIFAK